MRQRSLHQVRQCNFPQPPAGFPLLDAARTPRSNEEVVRRIAALSAVVSVSFGCAPKVALDWLVNEGLSDELSPEERSFLDGQRHDDPGSFQVPESLFALAWSIGLIDGGDDFAEVVPDSLIATIPHPPPQPRSASRARRDAKPVDVERAALALDLVCCLHWGIVDRGLRGEPLPPSPHPRVVVERRRSLKWLLGGEPWDEISIDT